MIRKNIFIRDFYFYYEGLMNMTMGERLWLIIPLKLFANSAILKLSFFSHILNENLDTDRQFSVDVIEQLTTPKNTSNND